MKPTLPIAPPRDLAPFILGIGSKLRGCATVDYGRDAGPVGAEDRDGRFSRAVAIRNTLRKLRAISPAAIQTASSATALTIGSVQFGSPNARSPIQPIAAMAAKPAPPMRNVVGPR